MRINVRSQKKANGLQKMPTVGFFSTAVIQQLQSSTISVPKRNVFLQCRSRPMLVRWWAAPAQPAALACK